MTHTARIMYLLSALALWTQLACGSSATPARKVDTSAPASQPTPPVAEVRPHEIASPHGTRVDPYFWLRDDTRKDPQVLADLGAENAYTKAVLAGTETLQKTLYDEMLARIKQDDSTVPVLDDGYWYYVRFETGKEYPIYARRKGEMSAPEEILLDANELARGHEFYRVGDTDVSTNGKLLAYTEDTVGRNQYVLRIKNLDTGELLPDTVSSIDAGVVWANDNRTVLYVAKHPVTLLPHKVHKHVLGTDPATDPLVYEETDNTFYTSISKSKSDKYLYIVVSSTLSSEVRYADAGDPRLAFKVFLPREPEHEYSIEHQGDRFVIRTNWQAKNFRLMSAPVGKGGNKKAWREIIGHKDDVFVHGFEVFKDYLAVSERSGGLRKIRVMPWKGKKSFYIESDEPAYTTYLAYTPEIDSFTLRYRYTSLTTPMTTYDYDMRTGEKILLKQDPVLGGFEAADYVTEYVHAPARDGARVPVSLVYRKGTPRDGTAPLYLWGYGSYGASMDPYFNSDRLSLLDRGFVFAIAHIRGGQELGRQWYESGKLLHKMNTFNDFIDVTEFLVSEGYAARDKVFGSGGSAGGLLVGAVANMRPELYRGIIAHVPFVDVVTTMLDDDIPLTTGEFDEWGDPKKKEFYDYILSYSPYDNVKRQDYPAMFVTTGLWDSQVQYFEPAKWVARLRALKTDESPLLLHINMEAGHGGRSGRFERLRERAMEYGFIFHVLGRS
jgi:oligopeptidase B